MNKIKFALMAAGVWWVWTQIGPMLPAGGVSVPRTEPAQQPHTDPQPHSSEQSQGLDDAAWWRVLAGNLNHEWELILSENGRRYSKPRLIIEDDSRGGPHYDPGTRTVHISPAFRSQVPCRGKTCDFALAVISAHEWGHHIHNITGSLGNGPSEELASDCLAGLWAAHENKRLNGTLVEPGDIEAALRMSNAFGDSARGSGGHGSGAQRQAAFQRGFSGGALSACNARGA